MKIKQNNKKEKEKNISNEICLAGDVIKKPACVYLISNSKEVSVRIETNQAILLYIHLHFNPTSQIQRSRGKRGIFKDPSNITLLDKSTRQTY